MQDVVKHNSSPEKNKLKRKHKKNYSIHITLVSLIAIIAFFTLSLTVFFNIETVSISGTSIYSADEILTASSIQSGNNMVRTNMSNAADSIINNLIYIENAEVKRSFPSTVKISVTPCVETANLEYENGYFVISKSGKILMDADSPFPDILTFYGTSPKEDMKPGMVFESTDSKKTANIFELIDITLNGIMRDKISSYEIYDRLNVSCVYEDRIIIELGAVSEIEYKFKFANTILKEKIGPETEGILKMLTNSATFIDKNAMEQNENVFLNNTNENNTETTPTETTTTAETTVAIINFE